MADVILVATILVPLPPSPSWCGARWRIAGGLGRTQRRRGDVVDFSRPCGSMWTIVRGVRDKSTTASPSGSVGRSASRSCGRFICEGCRAERETGRGAEPGQGQQPHSVGHSQRPDFRRSGNLLARSVRLRLRGRWRVGQSARGCGRGTARTGPRPSSRRRASRHWRRPGFAALAPAGSRHWSRRTASPHWLGRAGPASPALVRRAFPALVAQALCGSSGPGNGPRLRRPNPATIHQPATCPGSGGS